VQATSTSTDGEKARKLLESMLCTKNCYSDASLNAKPASDNQADEVPASEEPLITASYVTL